MRKMLEAQKGEEFQKNKLQVLAELTKIRQICCDPELLFEKYTGGSAKRDVCIQLIQSAIEGEHKILVFSQFTSMLELLEQELKKAKIDYFKITGETPKQKRVETVNTFNGDTTPVFLISLKAGGTGLNLTGADVVIHYDPWWNQAAQNQATDRAHRIGQTKTVTVYKLIAKNTIEEKIVKIQESKKDLADAILSGENGSITQMNKEEIMELLEI
ncbi:MAG: SWF/SNF helicase family protein [Lachnospiraceae bacterium]|nr:SWF/SNF helicase family protein [Lachnospiraceae bacterium]